MRKDAPLELLGPLACSGQTGAGAVFNVMRPKPGESFAVFGVGAVGLSALMAAKIAGCDPIVAVDVHGHRLALARELGATHAIDHGSSADVVGEIRAITGRGVRYSLETSALPAVFREAVEALMPGGTCVLLGSARRGTEVSIDMKFLQEGRVVRGVIQGDSVPEGIHTPARRSDHGRQISDREDDKVLRFCRHQSGGARNPRPASRSSRCCGCRNRRFCHVP